MFTAFYLGAFLNANGQNPLDLPLLQFGGISYAGAFKIPSAGNVPTNEQTDYSIGTMGYNPGTPGSLFISCHHYPYKLQIMADVSAGLKKPWEVQPYAIWPIHPPLGGIRGGGAGWDPMKRRIYFAGSHPRQGSCDG